MDVCWSWRRYWNWAPASHSKLICRLAKIEHGFPAAQSTCLQKKLEPLWISWCTMKVVQVLARAWLQQVLQQVHPGPWFTFPVDLMWSMLFLLTHLVLQKYMVFRSLDLWNLLRSIIHLILVPRGAKIDCKSFGGSLLVISNRNLRRFMWCERPTAKAARSRHVKGRMLPATLLLGSVLGESSFRFNFRIFWSRSWTPVLKAIVLWEICDKSNYTTNYRIMSTVYSSLIDYSSRCSSLNVTLNQTTVVLLVWLKVVMVIRLKGRFKFQMEVVAAEKGVVVGRL